MDTAGCAGGNYNCASLHLMAGLAAGAPKHVMTRYESIKSSVTDFF
ncbi:MAG: hypothetical protein IT314_15590 [Anaerolineales bacterium]|nr:hypothetical protein [Anaerolineales bacterium]